MFNKIKEFFTGKPAEVVAEVPYKVEVAPAVAPVVDTADIAIAQLPDPVAVQVVVESIAPAKAPTAKKTPAKKTPAAKKPRAPKAVK
jgi:hypothetical protein